MAYGFVCNLPASLFTGDDNTIFAAGDQPAVHAGPSGRSAVQLDDGAAEYAAVSASFTWPTDCTSGSGVAVDIHYFGDAAPGGNNGVDFEVALECFSESDAHDLHGTPDCFAASQATTDTIDANAGEPNVARIEFTQAQADNIEPGDAVRVAIRRDSDDMADTYADAVWVTHITLYEKTV